MLMKLSIITINYNNCEGLRKTIESVVNQTWKEFEWIIVDGGSSDESKKLIEETAHQLSSQGWYTENFSLISFTVENWKNGTNPTIPLQKTSSRSLLWCSEKDRGIYNAMNKGILMANGIYCLFLNSGDWLYDDNSLHCAVDYLGEADFISGYLCDTNGRRLTEPDFLTKSLTAADLLRSYIHHQATFIRTQILVDYGGYSESYKIASDMKFMLESLIINRATEKRIPVNISCYDTTGISASNTQLTQRETKEVIESIIPPLLIEDFYSSLSLSEVRKHCVFKILYSLLYRCAVVYNHFYLRLK